MHEKREKRGETVRRKNLQNRNPITMRYRGEDFAAFAAHLDAVVLNGVAENAFGD